MNTIELDRAKLLMSTIGFAKERDAFIESNNRSHLNRTTTFTSWDSSDLLLGDRAPPKNRNIYYHKLGRGANARQTQHQGQRGAAGTWKQDMKPMPRTGRNWYIKLVLSLLTLDSSVINWLAERDHKRDLARHKVSRG